MHGKEAPELLTPWLPATPDVFDIYAIGTQEAERSIQQSLINPSKAKWEAKLKAALGPSFELVGAVTLAAIHLAVYAKSHLRRDAIRHVQTCQVPTGIGNALGNKGGTAISLQLGGSSICFVNAHLTAHQHKVAERNADYHRIETALVLRPRGRSRASTAGSESSAAAEPAAAERAAASSASSSDDECPEGAAEAAAEGATPPPAPRGGFDFVFWFGDLNYRIDGTIAPLLLRVWICVWLRWPRGRAAPRTLRRLHVAMQARGR